MPVLVKGDDVRSGRKAKARHGQLRAAQASMGQQLFSHFTFFFFWPLYIYNFYSGPAWKPPEGEVASWLKMFIIIMILTSCVQSISKWWSLNRTVFVFFRCKCGYCIIASLQTISKWYCCSELGCQDSMKCGLVLEDIGADVPLRANCHKIQT